VIGAVVGAAVSGGIVALVGDGGSSSTSTAPGRASATLARPGDVRSILAKVEPGVVSISTTGFSRGFFEIVPSRGAGTGMILTPDGDVLTNAHVVAGASRIQVKLSTQDKTFDASLVGSDTTADVALLHLRGASGLATVTLGRSAALQVGDQVVAVGNALALPGGPTVTTGIVSALDRTIQASAQERLEHLVQTDAAINPGNSGGPLADTNGDVVGMNTAVIQNTGEAQAQNIGFAISSDTIRPVVDDLRKGGGSPTAQAFLGVTTSTPQAGSGAVVLEVTPGSPADGAGIQPGDVVTALGSSRVQSSADLLSAVRSHKPGDKVELRWTSGGQERSDTVTLVPGSGG
jgi:S1-C subfamily serine protease